MKTTLPLFETGEARDIAKRHCRSIAVSIQVLESLIQAELEQVGKMRKRGLYERFDELLSEDSE